MAMTMIAAESKVFRYILLVKVGKMFVTRIGGGDNAAIQGHGL